MLSTKLILVVIAIVATVSTAAVVVVTVIVTVFNSVTAQGMSTATAVKTPTTSGTRSPAPDRAGTANVTPDPIDDDYNGFVTPPLPRPLLPFL